MFQEINAQNGRKCRNSDQELNYFLKVGRQKFIKMFKLKIRLIVAVMVMFGITVFMGCEKENSKEVLPNQEDNLNAITNEIASFVTVKSNYRLNDFFGTRYFKKRLCTKV